MLVEAQLQQQDGAGMEGADIPNMDSMPSDAKRAMQGQGMAGNQMPGSGREDIHPSLRKYDTVVNVGGDGEED